MGFHNVLTGQDLHEPSRVRIVNDTQNSLIPGQLVLVNGPVSEGVISVTQLADNGDILVGFVDTIIAAGNDSTIILFGRINEVGVDTAATNPIVEGDYVRVVATKNNAGVVTNNRLDRAINEEGRVGIVLRRGTFDALTMNILFNPLGAIKKPIPQYMFLTRPQGLVASPLATIIPILEGETSVESVPIPLQFLNTEMFSFTTENDSFEFDPTNPARLTIKQSGAYEFGIFSNVSFEYPFRALDTTAEDGQIVNTAFFNLIVRRIEGTASPAREDIFRVDAPSRTFSQSGSAGTDDLNFTGELTPSVSSSRSPSTTDSSSRSVTPKIVNFDAGDEIGVFYEFSIVKSIAAVADGNFLLFYNRPAGVTDTFFDWALTIKRVD